jgi:hypothetical protein
VIGSPVARINQNTIETRMKIVGKMSRKRMRIYRVSPPPALRVRSAGRVELAGGVDATVVIVT